MSTMAVLGSWSALDLLFACMVAYCVYFVFAVTAKLSKIMRERRRAGELLRKKFPGPKGHPILGVFPEFGANIHRLNDWWLDLYKEYKGDGKTIVIPPPVFFESYEVITLDPKILKRFLHDEFDIYTKNVLEEDEFAYYFTRWLGEGIFNSAHGKGSKDDGALWRYQRKIAAQIFTKSNFRDHMFKIFIDKSELFLSLLDKRVEEAKGGELVLDLQKMFFAFTMDSIMKIFFDAETQTLQEKVDPFTSAFDDAQRQMMHCFTNFVPVLFSRLLPWPFGGINGLVMTVFHKTNPAAVAFEKDCRIIDEGAKKIINDRRKKVDSLDGEDDMLALFMRQKDPEGVPLHHPKYTRYLRDLIVNMILAGRDTTACTLTWSLYLLATNPKVYESLLAEVDEKLGEETPSFESIASSNMPYLQGVIMESLRLYPPVPRDQKRCFKEDILEDGTVIPFKTLMDFFPYGMGRDPEQFEDPLECKPERWQELGLNYMKAHQYEFPVFQAGYRIWISQYPRSLGMDMAQIEAKLLLAMLCQHYTFDLVEGEKEKISYSMSITMSLVNGPDSYSLLMHPHPRKK